MNTDGHLGQDVVTGFHPPFTKEPGGLQGHNNTEVLSLAPQ